MGEAVEQSLDRVGPGIVLPVGLLGQGNRRANACRGAVEPTRSTGLLRLFDGSGDIPDRFSPIA
jgi:hypothetical protein